MPESAESAAAADSGVSSDMYAKIRVFSTCSSISVGAVFSPAASAFAASTYSYGNRSSHICHSDLQYAGAAAAAAAAAAATKG